MTAIDEDLVAELIADADITAEVGTRVHYSHVPQGFVGSYIWIGRSGSSDDEDRALGDAVGQKYHFKELFDVECVSDTLGSESALALLLKKFDSKRDSLGNGNIQAMFVRDHADDYVRRNSQGDDGVFVASLQFELIGYTE